MGTLFQQRFLVALPATIAAALMVLPHQARAQACLGVPTQDGQWALTGSVAFFDDERSYSSAVTADLEGPLAVGAGYAYASQGGDLVGSSQSVTGRMTFEVGRGAWSVCPQAGASYGWTKAETDDGILEVKVDGWGIPLGISFARTVETGPNVSVIPFGGVSYERYRTEGTMSAMGSLVDLETVSGGQFSAVAGVAWRIEQFAFGGWVGATTDDDSPTVAGIHLTVLVGG